MYETPNNLGVASIVRHQQELREMSAGWRAQSGNRGGMKLAADDLDEWLDGEPCPHIRIAWENHGGRKVCLDCGAVESISTRGWVLP